MDLTEVVADIARNLGREFPQPLVPWQEMVLRQLSSLAEEAIELDVALAGESAREAREELAQTVISAYLVAHYMGNAGASLDEAASMKINAMWLGPSAVAEQPYRAAGRAMQAGRRYLGIARRKGPAGALVLALADTVVAAHAVAQNAGISIEAALIDTVTVIFSRGWHAEEATDVLD